MNLLDKVKQLLAPAPHMVVDNSTKLFHNMHRLSNELQAFAVIGTGYVDNNTFVPNPEEEADPNSIRQANVMKVYGPLKGSDVYIDTDGGTETVGTIFVMENGGFIVMDTKNSVLAHFDTEAELAANVRVFQTVQTF